MGHPVTPDTERLGREGCVLPFRPGSRFGEAGGVLKRHFASLSLEPVPPRLPACGFFGGRGCWAYPSSPSWVVIPGRRRRSGAVAGAGLFRHARAVSWGATLGGRRTPSGPMVRGCPPGVCQGGLSFCLAGAGLGWRAIGGLAHVSQGGGSAQDLATLRRQLPSSASGAPTHPPTPPSVRVWFGVGSRCVGCARLPALPCLPG